MKYDDLTIQRLRELPIFEVCSRLGISLYGIGAYSRRALCWYHDDKHPSMHINKKKNIFKCFVCGKGGDTIRLVQDYSNLTFVEACDWLVREFSVTVTSTESPIPTHHSCNSKDSCSKNNSVVSDISVCQRKSVPSVKSVTPLDASLVSRSISLTSEFCQAVVSSGYLTELQMRHAAKRYCLGASRNGSVIFWEIDEQLRVHNGKFMHYQSDCHRDKLRTPTWVVAEMKKTGTLPSDFENPHCLFGLHLLTSTNISMCQDKSVSSVTSQRHTLLVRESVCPKKLSDISGISVCQDKSVSSVKSVCPKNVCVVESEKSAVILSELFPDYVWLSCGGLQMFKPELLAPLVNHKVMVFPDTDETGATYKAWQDIVQQASKHYSFHYPIRISPILEVHASAEQKRRKIDLIDLLFESVVKPVE